MIKTVKMINVLSTLSFDHTIFISDSLNYEHHVYTIIAN